MSIHVALRHLTRYRYDRAISLGPQAVRLRPAPHCRTRILSYSMKVTPESHFINWQQDPQPNYIARVVFPEKTCELNVEVEVIGEMSVINPFDFFLEAYADDYPFAYEPSQLEELEPYLKKEQPTPLLQQYLSSISREKLQTVSFLVAVNQRVANDIRYLIRLEPGVQTPDESRQNASRS